MMTKIDHQAIRILEIGSHTVFKQAFPERTTTLYSYRRAAQPETFLRPFSIRSALQAWRDVRNKQFDLIVVWVEPYAPWNFRQLKAVVDRPFRPFASLIRIFAVQWLRLVRTAIPIVVIDNEDSRTIAPHNFFLFDKARFFFKRELPMDRWQVFQHTFHGGMPGARFRMTPRRRRWVEKLRPISIGVTPLDAVPAELPFPEKTTDVFAALTLEGGTVIRNEGIRQLQALAAEGVTIDIPQQRLTPAEFKGRMARAWLTWSPEGLGWDCFRHYEAPLLHSIPLSNRPTIWRYRPLLDGIHAFYYQPDVAESLGDTVRSALADKSRLRSIAHQARAHVMQYHLRPRPFADNMIDMVLGDDEPPGGIELS